MQNKKLFKIILLTADSVFLLLAVTFIPLNLFVANFSEALPIVFGAISVVGIAAYLILFKTKLVTKIILPIVFALVFVAVAVFPFMFPYWNSYLYKGNAHERLNYDETLTYREAKSDLDYAMRYLKKVHPMFMHGLTDEIEQGYKDAIERLKRAETITVNDLRREIQRVINPMHDAHTTTSTWYPADRYLKSAPKLQHDGFYIASINGIERQEIFDRAKPYYSYESEDWIMLDLGSLATLDFYGYNAPFTYVWQDGSGNTITEVYTEADFITYAEFMEIYRVYFPQTEPKDFVYYEIDESNSLAVLTLTQCIYNDTYVNCVRQMFTEIKQKGIKNIAVDLRGNGGGNSRVANEFIKYLPIDEYNDLRSDVRLGFVMAHYDGRMKNDKQNDLLFTGNVYVLTDSSSFSAAKDFAMLIQDNKLGKVVGISPANAVNGYGDVAVFQLPKSGIVMQMSIKKWYRADPENSDDYVIPDYPCDGRTALETVYQLIGN